MTVSGGNDPGTHTTLGDSTDLPCIICDYNLRGLDRAGRCPECGQAIEASYRQQLQQRQDPLSLAASRPRWRRSVAIGLWTVLASTYASCVWGVANLGYDLVGAMEQFLSQPAVAVPMTGLALLLFHSGMLATTAYRPLPRPWNMLRLGLRLLVLINLAAEGWMNYCTFASSFSWEHYQTARNATAIVGSVLTVSAWCYWSVVLREAASKAVILMRVNAVVVAATAVALPFVSVPVRPTMQVQIMGDTCVGALGAPTMLVRSLMFEPRVDQGVIVYLLAGMSMVVAMGLLIRMAVFVTRWKVYP
jgi:hypothetical protein